MKARCAVLAPASVLALALTAAGCGGDDKPPAGAAASSAPPAAVPSVPVGTSSAGSTMPALPKVNAAQVKGLVGRWVGPNGDYFQFKGDGTGAWMKGGQALWNGKVIPEGKGRFRFSWEGGDPKDASYWGATLTAGGTKMLFAGTNQTYTKARG